MTDESDFCDDVEDASIGSATYSLDDNKLRLYADARLDAETYARVKSAGFKWAPKQELFVAPSWSPEREDLLLELCGDIGDEDYSPEERAADRADRFSGYRDKRRGEAGGSADAFDAGPSAFGHQNRARAERQAARHDRRRSYACNQWSKAEYWQMRTAGVISNALHRAKPAVRRSRILTLEAEQRKLKKDLAEYAEKYAAWQKVMTLEGCDQTLAFHTAEGLHGVDKTNTNYAALLAYAMVNEGGCYGRYTHPRADKTGSLYELMTFRDDPITAAEAYSFWMTNAYDPSDETTCGARWARHYENRLSYERAMLANEGGSAADVEMVAGGWVGGRQIQKVNKSPVTKRVVSVDVLGLTSVNYDRHGKPYNEDNPRPMTIHNINVERFGEDAYRPPTDEELQEFKAATAEWKAEAKSGNVTISLINPTDADADRLQAHWNKLAKAKHDAKVTWEAYKPSEVCRITQAQYSANSKGEYAQLETRTLDGNAKPSRRSSNLWSSEGAAYDKALAETVCKLRMRSGSGWNSADRVIVLTDKPQKPLPLDWAAIETPLEVVTA